MGDARHYGLGEAEPPIKYTVINVASSGDNTLLAAITNRKIRVHGYAFVCGGAVSIRFESGSGGTALTGIMEVAANSGVVVPYCQKGWFETAISTLLNLELSGAVNVDGHLIYSEV